MSERTVPLRIGIVAGEASGDNLAAGLIKAIRERLPDAQFEGVAGPRMQEVGCSELFPMKELAVMGLVEVIRHLPRLLSIRRQLRRHFLENGLARYSAGVSAEFQKMLEEESGE